MEKSTSWGRLGDDLAHAAACGLPCMALVAVMAALSLTVSELVHMGIDV